MIYGAKGPMVAIDFGTARVKVAYYDEQKECPRLANIGREILTILPALFHLGEQGICVGDVASDLAETDPGGLVSGLKRQINLPGKLRLGTNRPEPTRVEVAAHMFRHIKNHLENEVFQQEIHRCRLTVPAGFEEGKRQKIREAAERGGFWDIDIMDEPVAAGRAWLRNTVHNVDALSVIVCDIGGGTSDFALLKKIGANFEPDPAVPPYGRDLGGGDLDTNIAEAFQSTLEKRYCGSHLKLKLQRVRERITNHGQKITLHLGGDSAEVDKELIEQQTTHFLEDLMDIVMEYLGRCDTAGVPQDTPLVLIGGASRIPGFKERVEAVSGRKIYQWEDSDYAVVLGAVDVPMKKQEAAPKKTEKEIAYDAYRAKVEAYWDDGEISRGEYTMLLNLRRQLEISREEAEQIETVVCGKSAEDLLLPVSRPSSTPLSEDEPEIKKQLNSHDRVVLEHAEQLASGIRFDCPTCRGALHRDMIWVGRTTECEHCSQRIYIPRHFGNLLASVGGERTGKIVGTDSILLLVTCPGCGQVLTRKKHLRHKYTRCDKCKTEFRVGCADDSTDVEKIVSGKATDGSEHVVQKESSPYATPKEPLPPESGYSGFGVIIRSIITIIFLIFAIPVSFGTFGAGIIPLWLGLYWIWKKY